MRAFFACLRLEQQVGCSPSTLRAVMEQLEVLILETTEGWERDGIAQGQRCFSQGQPNPSQCRGRLSGLAKRYGACIKAGFALGTRPPCAGAPLPG
jgi:hypothetical protein